MKIDQNAEYSKENLMHFQGEISRNQMHKLLESLNEHIAQNNARSMGSYIVCIHTLNIESRTADIEIFISVDRRIADSMNFRFVEKFNLENCLLTQSRGDKILLPEVYTKMYHYSVKEGLEIEQPFYVVSNNCPSEILGLQTQDVDIYVRLRDATE
ncbi:MAG: hypothetical protein FWC91_13020 [Defluviitaleaceae bacterium]|nr:hypothetical protein [Defluviitaleaceae bacterium]